MNQNLENFQKQSEKISLGEKLKNFTIKLIRSIFTQVSKYEQLDKYYKNISKLNGDYKNEKQNYQNQIKKLKKQIVSKAKSIKEAKLSRKKKTDRFDNINNNLQFSLQKKPSMISNIDLSMMTKTQNTIANLTNPTSGVRSVNLRNSKAPFRLSPK